MSHPVPGHDYSEKTYRSDSPHKDEPGVYPKKSKLNKTQKMTGGWLKAAGKHLRKEGESPLGHLKRLTSPKTKALDKLRDKQNK